MADRYTLEELQEEEFGFLRILDFAPPIYTRKKKKITRVKCICICGNIKDFDLKNLLSGNSISCGCKKGRRY